MDLSFSFSHCFNNFIIILFSWIFLSLSLTASTTSSSFSLSFSKSKSSSIPKATPSDLLSVLGPTSQSSTVNPLVAKQLKSCFKFLVQFTPRKSSTQFQDYTIRRSLKDQNFKTQREQNELIWWPPESVLVLARLAVDSGGDPDAIFRALDPTVLPVPDVEGCKEYRCELTRTPYGRRFISQELNSYLRYLFELIVARGSSVEFSVSLNRYDLFHGHLILATESGRLGILVNPKWIVYHSLVSTDRHYMHNVISIDPSWLLEAAPHFYQHQRHNPFVH